MPRKSTASVMSATGPMETNPDDSMISNAAAATSPTRTTTANSAVADPVSPSRTKAEGQRGKPGRKPAAAAGADEEGTTEKSSRAGKSKGDDLSIDDLLLPRTLISRLARGSLPPNTSLQKDALLALTKSATVFISYLAHTSNSITSRKTIQAADVLEAIREMELEGVMGRKLEGEIKLFDEGVRGKRRGYRDRVKARESGTSLKDGEDGEDGGLDDAIDPNPAGKRMRFEMPELTDPEESLVGLVMADSESDTDPAVRSRREAQRVQQDDQMQEDNEDRNDDTEDDADIPEDDEDDAVENEDDEDEDGDDEEESQGPSHGKLDMDEEEKTRRKAAMLVPDGRVEVGSDDDSD